MIKPWSPANWSEITQKLINNAPMEWEGNLSVFIEQTGDALLEALKEYGVYGMLLEGLVKKEDGKYVDLGDGHYRQKGWLIFIPD